MRFQLTLGLLALGFVPALAMAEAMPAKQAMQLLAKAQAVDLKCKFLAANDHDELSKLAARAELSLAQSASVATAMSAISQGRKDGQSTSCSDADRAELSNVLSAARTATLKLPTTKPEPAPETVVKAEPVVIPPVIAEVPKAEMQVQTMVPRKSAVIQPAVPKKLVVVAKLAKPLVVKKSTAEPDTKLANYTALTEHYFRARRCGTMSDNEINALYQNVVATHRRTLLALGRNKVASAMRRAEAHANSQSCS